MALDMAMPVLVVDDVRSVVQIVSNLLKQIGFTNIEDATAGEEALGKMREKKYGLVIVDWNMEPLNGLDLLKQVRADTSINKTPFVMITAESKPEKVIAAKKAGVSNYIVKPFNAPILKGKIEAIFAPAPV